MNWGYKIIIIYSAFVLGIVFMVYKATQQNTDLVTTDYYAKELVYQDRIDEAKRTSLLSAQITIETIGSKVELSIPEKNKGFHYIQVSWVTDGLSYYYEQKINL